MYQTKEILKNIQKYYKTFIKLFEQTYCPYCLGNGCTPWHLLKKKILFSYSLLPKQSNGFKWFQQQWNSISEWVPENSCTQKPQEN